MNRLRVIVIGIVVVVAAILGATIALGQSAPFSFGSEDRLREMSSTLGTEVASFPAQSGTPDRSVFVAKLSDGSLCVRNASADKATWGGGCNPAESPLGGKPFMAMFSFVGGPEIKTVIEARLYGLVDSEVYALKAEMSDGSTRTLGLSAQTVAATPYRVFAERVARADLHNGISPIAIVAYNVSGTEIARQPTGIG